MLEDFFGQGWWQGVGVILTLVVGVAAIIISIRQNKSKRLSYNVVYSSSLISVKEEIRNDLKIYYRDREVSKINVLKISFVNDGNLPIKRIDFDENPIKIELKNCGTLFRYEATDRLPEDLDISLKDELNTIMISPTLINPKDFFSVQIMFDGSDREFEIHARIEGISKLTIVPLSNLPEDLFFNTKVFLIVWLILGTFFLLCFVAIMLGMLSPLVGYIIGAIASLVILAKTLSERLSNQFMRKL